MIWVVKHVHLNLNKIVPNFRILMSDVNILRDSRRSFPSETVDDNDNLKERQIIKSFHCASVPFLDSSYLSEYYFVSSGVSRKKM